MIDQCKEHIFKENEYKKTWASGGFGDGTLIRNCLICGYYEIMFPKENEWKYGGDDWK